MQPLTEKKENLITWLIRYVRESKEEMGKVTWPTQKETVKYSLICIAISIFIAAFFGGLDWVLTFGLEQLVSFTS